MNRSERTPISDELLSAYIDGAVTHQERATVEAAISADPALAWEVESLRRTVELVQALPPIALPRSFALREDQVADVLAERRSRVAVQATAAPAQASTPRQPAVPPRRSFWTEFFAFFNSGNLLLRNATAVAALLFVVVMITSPGLTPYSSSLPATAQRQAELSTSPASQPEPALALVAEEPANTSADAESADAQADAQADVQSEEAPPAAAKAAPAPMAEMAPAQASAPPVSAAALEAAPAEMDAGAASASMAVGPEGQDAPAARMMPEARGGGLESGPALFQAAPAAALAPIGEEPALGDIPEQAEIRRPMEAAIGEAPMAESVPEESATEMSMAEVPAEAAADAPADVTADIAADAAAIEESSPAVAAQSAPAELSEEPAAKALQAPSVSVEPYSAPAPVPGDSGLPWAYWSWLQAAVGGLALLLGALWLYTRRA